MIAPALAHFEFDAAVIELALGEHRASLEELRPCTTCPGRELQDAVVQIDAELAVERLEQQVDSLSAVRRDPDAVDAPVGVHLDVPGFAGTVDLVVHRDLRQRPGADRVEHLVHLRDALRSLGIRGVDDVQQQVRLAGLL